MTTIHFTSLQVAITLTGIDGLPKATPAIRPLRKTPTGFGVVFHGKVLPVVPTSGNTGTASLTGVRMDPATCPVAKKSDLGLAPAAAKPEPKAQPAATFTKAPEQPAAEGGKKPRTIPQMEATVAMATKRAERVVGSGDERQIAAALKALATAEANLAEARKAEIAAIKAAYAERKAGEAKPAKASKAKQPKAEPVTQAPAAKAPTKAELMAQIEALTALLASAK